MGEDKSIDVKKKRKKQCVLRFRPRLLGGHRVLKDRLIQLALATPRISRFVIFCVATIPTIRLLSIAGS